VTGAMINLLSEDEGSFQRLRNGGPMEQRGAKANRGLSFEHLRMTRLAKEQEAIQ
jgi:hypothetical protein